MSVGCIAPSPRISMSYQLVSGVNALVLDIVPSAETDNGIALAADGLWAQGPGRRYNATALPEDTSNFDGRFAYVQPTDGVTWMLRRHEGGARSNKWEFVGGPPLAAYQETQGTIAPGGSFDWQDLGGTDVVGPDISIPYDGVYHVDFACRIWPSAAANNPQVGVSIGGADPDVTDHVAQLGVNFAYTPLAGTEVGRFFDSVGMARGTRLRLLYRSDGTGGTATFSHRRIRVTPIRIAGG